MRRRKGRPALGVRLLCCPSLLPVLSSSRANEVRASPSHARSSRTRLARRPFVTRSCSARSQGCELADQQLPRVSLDTVEGRQSWGGSGCLARLGWRAGRLENKGGRRWTCAWSEGSWSGWTGSARLTTLAGVSFRGRGVSGEVDGRGRFSNGKTVGSEVLRCARGETRKREVACIRLVQASAPASWCEVVWAEWATDKEVREGQTQGRGSRPQRAARRAWD